MADDCAALVRHLALPKVDIAGHSMGGMIAQDYAIRYPELTDRVVRDLATAFIDEFQLIALYRNTRCSVLDRMRKIRQKEMAHFGRTDTVHDVETEALLPRYADIGW